MTPKMRMAAMSSVVSTGRRMNSAGLMTASAGLISTRAPGTSRSWPSVTTRSPGLDALLDHELAGERGARPSRGATPR